MAEEQYFATGPNVTIFWDAAQEVANQKLLAGQKKNLKVTAQVKQALKTGALVPTSAPIPESIIEKPSSVVPTKTEPSSSPSQVPEWKDVVAQLIKDSEDSFTSTFSSKKISQLLGLLLGVDTTLDKRITGLESIMNSDDQTLSNLREVISYTKNNKSLLDLIAVGKVNKATAEDEIKFHPADLAFFEEIIQLSSELSLHKALNKIIAVIGKPQQLKTQSKAITEAINEVLTAVIETSNQSGEAYNQFNVLRNSLAELKKYFDLLQTNSITIIEKGASKGVATLDANSKLAASQIPLSLRPIEIIDPILPSATIVLKGNANTDKYARWVTSIAQTVNYAGNASRGDRLYCQIAGDQPVSRNITFGIGFKTTGSIAVVSSSKTCMISFIYDGTTFIEVSRTIL